MTARSSDAVQAAFDSAIHDFKQNLKNPGLYNQILQTTSIDQVYDATDQLQKEHSKNRRLTHLCKIQPFLNGLRDYAGVVDTFVQVKPDIFALIWGPIKLLLQWADALTQSLAAITDILEEVGSLLPNFCEARRIFTDSVRLQEILVLFFRDILDLYLITIKFFSLSRLKIVFEALWPSRRDQIKVIAKHIARHRELMRTEVRLEEIRAADEARERELEDFARVEENAIDSAHVSPKTYGHDLYRHHKAVCDGTGKWPGSQLNSSPTQLENLGVQSPQDIQSQAPTGLAPSHVACGSHTATFPEDSGYGSVAERACPSYPKTQERVNNNAVNDDAETTYSKATNEDLTQTHDFVYELASDIYGKLGPTIDSEDWPLLSKVLPDLLKALAIKIGGDVESQAHRDIMYFIHKEHRNIIEKVQNLVICPQEDAEVTSCTDADMSLRDKMDLWDQMQSVDEDRPNNVELFQNVNDNYSDIAASFMYKKIVLESEDYDWLIQSLKTELSLERDETASSGDDTSIRRQILSMLPSGKISKRRGPTKHHVVFRLPTPSIKHLRSDRMVVTSGSRNLQLARISAYVDQTWPFFGRKVLSAVSFLGTALQGRDLCTRLFSTVLGDGTELVTSVGLSHSLIRLIGPGYSIAEIGEQLAWLVGATSEFPSSVDGGIVFSNPSVSKTDKFTHNSCPAKWSGLEIPQPVFSTCSGSETIVGVEIEVLGDKKLLEGQPGTLWDRLLGYSSGLPIVRSYPTTRRRDGCPGLELSFDMLQVARSTGFGQSTSLKEAFASLVLAGSSKGVFYWHERHSCRCSTELFLEAHGDSIPLQLPNNILKAGRHVICNCEINIEREEQTSSAASSSTSSNSLNGGIVSVSSDSMNIEQQDSQSPGFSFFKDVLQHIVQKYLSQAPSDGGSSTTDSRAVPPGTGSFTPRGGPSTDIRPRKRLHEDEDDEGDGDNPQPRKRLKGPPSRSLGKPRFLACPFWKLDPKKHWECFLKKLTTVSYVKQHLSRRHTPTLYCQRCFAIFDHAASHQQHVFGEPCTPRPLARLDGITPDQSHELSKKSKGTIEEQWYAIWEILFPREPRPLSIYVDPDQSPDLALLREFSQREGVSVLHRRIRETSRILRSDVSEQEVRHALSQALDSLFEYYRLGQDPISVGPSESERRISNEPRPQGAMAVNRSTDSGVMLTSHSSHGSNADDLAITAVPEDNNEGTVAMGAIESVIQVQPHPVDSSQVPEVFNAFNTGMPEDWGILGGTESVFGRANLDELCDRLFVQGGAAEFDVGLDVNTWAMDGEWRQP